jgi:hypothetical protein
MAADQKRYLSLETLIPDGSNRLDALRPNEQPPVKAAQDIRKKLRALETAKIPACPKEQILNLNDLFRSASKAVTELWTGNKDIQKTLQGHLEKWISKIPADEEKRGDLIRIMKSPKAIERMLDLQQMGALEDIRTLVPEAWRTLILLSAERQMAAMTLVRHWIKELSEEDYQRLKFSKEELRLFMDTASIFGKYFDQAYVKQIELADLPGGSETDAMIEKKKPAEGEEETTEPIPGSEYLYAPYVSENSDETRPMAFNEVFPFEFGKIVMRFKALAQRIRQSIQKGELPADRYQLLPGYLEKLANLNASSETDPQKLFDAWEDISKDSAKMAQAGCPINLIPQGTPSASGDANKVDVELRLELIGANEIENTRATEIPRAAAQQLLDGIISKNQALVEKPYPIPPSFLMSQPYSFGPNLHWLTQGQSDIHNILIHNNTVENQTAKAQLPLLEKMFPSDPLDHRNTISHAVKDTVLHEISHAIFHNEEPKVKKRIGFGSKEAGSQATVLEEIKAEMVGMTLLESMRQKNPDEISPEESLRAKVGGAMDWVANKSSKVGTSGERYYFAGAWILQALLEAGVIQERDGAYHLENHAKGLQILAQIGQKLLDDFYANPEATPEKVAQFIDHLEEKMKNDPKLRVFVEKLKA